MKNFFVFFLLIGVFYSSIAQEEVKVPFSVAISAHINKYNQRIDEAYEDNDMERATFLFDSLVDNHLKGTYMDNFQVNQLKGESLSLNSFEKPIYLVTYAAWCVPGIGEIPAFNDLVERFHDQIDFVVLFWDTEENLKSKADDYSEFAHLVYVDEKSNQNSYIINKLKHALGFPMTYFMDPDKKILDIRKVITHHSSESLSNSYNIHFNSLSKGVSLLIADLDTRPPEEKDAEMVTEDLSKPTGPRDDRTEEERRIDEEYEKYRREKDSLKKLRDN
ncbi:AhpC/TSA family protein [Aquimarina brevivitae]|uniref:AhpC/TSA family protein n=2 Tax=Aquimarina brevivitae TaxID=323412 RepID=A0A4Q7P462_9FLAO|nr:AhpC/TSA family protein [Aquimarina brevivitae]